MEAFLDKVGIYANKNTVPKDKSALVPSGLRVGYNSYFKLLDLYLWPVEV